jgi:hypothetical protein
MFGGGKRPYRLIDNRPVNPYPAASEQVKHHQIHVSPQAPRPPAQRVADH